MHRLTGTSSPRVRRADVETDSRADDWADRNPERRSNDFAELDPHGNAECVANANRNTDGRPNGFAECNAHADADADANAAADGNGERRNRCLGQRCVSNQWYALNQQWRLV